VTRVVLYTRAGCHLCDEARATILELQVAVPFVLEEIDIEGSDQLVRDYGVRIPVVTVDGQELFEYTVDATALRAAVTG